LSSWLYEMKSFLDIVSMPSINQQWRQ
jgi:hypothetical protein